MDFYEYESAINSKIEILHVDKKGEELIVTQKYIDDIQKLLDFPAYTDIRIYKIINGKIKHIIVNFINDNDEALKIMQKKWTDFNVWMDLKYPHKRDEIMKDLNHHGKEYLDLVKEYKKEKIKI